MAKTDGLDLELEDLPPALRWREWMTRAEAVLFASGQPVTRDVIARVVGRDCAIDLLMVDIAAELVDRPFEIARVAGGWQLRTRARFAETVRRARGLDGEERPLTRTQALILTAIAYLQPVTRGGLADLVGREVGRDTIARLHDYGLIARGPRSPEAGAPYTYVTTPAFLVQFGLESLRDLPDIEALTDAGLLRSSEPGETTMPREEEG